MKILFLVHGHQQFSVGGAENAAFSLFYESQKHDELEAWLLAAVHPRKGVVGHGELRSMEGAAREYLIGTSCEWFRFTNQNIAAMQRAMERLLHQIQPDVIHLHHFIHFGIDIIPLMKRLCPQAIIILTLHEYMALCLHNGQMVTTGQLKLCTKATPLACSLCFPEHASTNLFLRHHYIKTILESCDALISPSHFLIARFRDSGINHPRFTMIENGLSSLASIDQTDGVTKNYSDHLNRFAFFGQLNKYKGILLLLKAAYYLQERGFSNFIINVHGANLEIQSQEFQDEFHYYHQRVQDRVILRGSYRQTELENLMLESDWVIVPSIWWENSPLVIQEAFCYGRPVIGSDIGGIAEKVLDCGGVTFSARSESSLAARIQSCCGDESLHRRLRAQMQAPATAAKCLEEHLKIYQALRPHTDTVTSSYKLESNT